MAESKIMKCTCNHSGQDSIYGKNMRLFNPMGKTQDSGFRCTVCGKEVGKDGGSSVKKK